MEQALGHRIKVQLKIHVDANNYLVKFLDISYDNNNKVLDDIQQCPS
jgi:hypothetical protein